MNFSNLHMPSVLKAGGAAAGLAALLFLLSFIPYLGGIFVFCLLCGGFLIPIAAGIGYGYFAPGEEDMATSALGGALSGGAGGLLLGILSGISAGVSGAVSDGLGGALAGGTAATLFAVCGLGFAGLLFGAIGGVIWPTIQKNRGA